MVLDEPTLGIYIPPLVWASQFRYDPDSVLLVLALGCALVTFFD